jgi:hypothetical protein
MSKAVALLLPQLYQFVIPHSSFVNKKGYLTAAF